MRVRAEFTTEPFHGEGELPSHVSAAAAPLAAAGLTPDLGPLGTSVEGEADVVLDALAAGLKHALREGATRVTLNVQVASAGSEPTPAEVAAPGGSRRERRTDLSDGLARLIAEVEGELDGPLAGLPRAEKQHAVRLLEERGAFEMRRSAETVAEAMGLTRFTIYNYLNRVRGDAGDESA